MILALENKYGDQVQFITADVDTPQGASLADWFNVDSIPAFFLIDGEGQVIDQSIGIQPQNILEQQIKNLIQKSPVSSTNGFVQNFFKQTVPQSLANISLLTLVIIFLGGLITSLSPCIISMVPVIVGYVGGYSKTSRRQGFFMSLSFVLGLSVTFAILGISAALLGKIFGQIGVGWLYLVSVVSLVMGLNLLGIVNLKFPTLQKMPVKGSGTYGSSFLVGLFFGLVASPCATPVLAVLMTYVAGSGQLWYGGLLLFIYGLGHGVPLLVVGTFTSSIKQMPRFQKWGHYMTYLSGTVMIGLGLYFLYQTTL